MKAAGGTVSELSFPIADSTNPQTVTSDIGAYLAAHHGALAQVLAYRVLD